jgi:excisionase family DNA binding protein
MNLQNMKHDATSNSPGHHAGELLPKNADENTGQLKPMFFTVRDVSALLRMSERQVWRWIDRGELPVHGFDGAVRVARTDFDEFVRARRGKRPNVTASQHQSSKI